MLLCCREPLPACTSHSTADCKLPLPQILTCRQCQPVFQFPESGGETYPLNRGGLSSHHFWHEDNQGCPFQLGLPLKTNMASLVQLRAKFRTRCSWTPPSTAGQVRNFDAHSRGVPACLQRCPQTSCRQDAMQHKVAIFSRTSSKRARFTGTRTLLSYVMHCQQGLVFVSSPSTSRKRGLGGHCRADKRHPQKPRCHLDATLPDERRGKLAFSGTAAMCRRREVNAPGRARC